MAQATYYDPETGKITGTITCSESAFCPNVVGTDWTAGTYDAETYYIDTATGCPIPRPAMEGITVNGNIVSGLPVPCILKCGGVEYEITDGEFEYATPIPGTYPVRAEAFPYRDWEGELTVESNT